jgi:hypothetical protein
VSARSLKRLAIVGSALLLIWLIRLQRQVPHPQTPFSKATDFADQVVLEQGPKKIELKRLTGQWKVGRVGGPYFPADEENRKRLMSSLSSLRLENEISGRADRAPDFVVDAASGTIVRLANAKGEKLAEGIFGKQAPDFTHIYFRFPDRPNVSLAAGLLRGDLGSMDVNYWRSRQVFSTAENQIQEIQIEGRGFQTDLVRKATDSWTLDGKEVEPIQVNTLVGTLAHFRAEDFVDPVAYPKITAENLRYARVHVRGTASEAGLRIGVQDPKTKRYPASADDIGLVWLPEYSVQSILQKPSAFKPKK